MNRFKFIAYKKEFPFLNEILIDSNDIPRDESQISSIKIARLDEKVLNTIPVRNDHNGSLGSSGTRERFHFVLSNGEWLQDAVKQEESYRSNNSNEAGTHSEGETLLAAVDSFDQRKLIKFIVFISYAWSDWQGSDSCWKRNVVIYKLPKDETLQDILNRAHTEASREVLAEAAF